MAVKKSKNKPGPIQPKAYNNYRFLNSPPARPIRVLAEFLEPQDRLRKLAIYNTVVFFGSSRIISKITAMKQLEEIDKKVKKKAHISKSLKAKYEKAVWAFAMSRYYEAACQLSKKLTLWFKEIEKNGNHFIICTGGGPGIMEAANLGAKKAKGKSIGFNISLPREQNPNPYQTKELSFEFHYFFIRKFWFFYPAKALIIFPGGFGTMDELFELLTLVQTNKSKKYMPIVLFGSEYWNTIIDFKKMVQWGTISQSDLNLFRVSDDVEEAFNYLKKELSQHYLKKIIRD